VKGPRFNPVERKRNHGSIRLSLIGGFELVRDGHIADVPQAAARLLVFLALQERPIPRQLVAGSLWPETTDTRAGANLRSTLWRIAQLDGRLIQSAGHRLALGPTVAVDLEQARVKCRWLVDRTSVVPAGLLTIDLIDADLLADWDEDWLRKDQVGYRQHRLRALEALSQRLTDAGRHWDAVDVALEAVAAEPLRESAIRTLVQAYLADGNWAEAMRQYRSYRDLLFQELGVEPTLALVELMTPRRAVAGLALAAPASR
jgi:DNA-binding SARP family transcriptional activator